MQSQESNASAFWHGRVQRVSYENVLIPGPRRLGYLDARMCGFPNLRRAHGAWVCLTLSVAAGTLCADDDRIVPALLAGTAHVGAFQAVGGWLAGPRERAALLRGVALALGAPGAALFLGADRGFLAVSALTSIPAAGALLAAHRWGITSASALLLGSAAVAMAGPASAAAGGASLARCSLLVVALGSFFGWRALRVATLMRTSPKWRGSLRRLGLREAGLAAVWSIGVALGVS